MLVNELIAISLMAMAVSTLDSKEGVVECSFPLKNWRGHPSWPNDTTLHECCEEYKIELAAVQLEHKASWLILGESKGWIRKPAKRAVNFIFAFCCQENLRSFSWLCFSAWIDFPDHLLSPWDKRISSNIGHRVITSSMAIVSSFVVSFLKLSGKTVARGGGLRVCCKTASVSHLWCHCAADRWTLMKHGDCFQMLWSSESVASLLLNSPDDSFCNYPFLNFMITIWETTAFYIIYVYTYLHSFHNLLQYDDSGKHKPPKPGFTLFPQLSKMRSWQWPNLAAVWQICWCVVWASRTIVWKVPDESRMFGRRILEGCLVGIELSWEDSWIGDHRTLFLVSRTLWTFFFNAFLPEFQRMNSRQVLASCATLQCMIMDAWRNSSRIGSWVGSFGYRLDWYESFTSFRSLPRMIAHRDPWICSWHQAELSPLRQRTALGSMIKFMAKLIGSEKSSNSSLPFFLLKTSQEWCIFWKCSNLRRDSNGITFDSEIFHVSVPGLTSQREHLVGITQVGISNPQICGQRQDVGNLGSPKLPVKVELRILWNVVWLYNFPKRC